MGCEQKGKGLVNRQEGGRKGGRKGKKEGGLSK